MPLTPHRSKTFPRFGFFPTICSLFRCSSTVFKQVIIFLPLFFSVSISNPKILISPQNVYPKICDFFCFLFFHRFVVVSLISILQQSCQHSVSLSYLFFSHLCILLLTSLNWCRFFYFFHSCIFQYLKSVRHT